MPLGCAVFNVYDIILAFMKILMKMVMTMLKTQSPKLSRNSVVLFYGIHKGNSIKKISDPVEKKFFVASVIQ